MRFENLEKKSPLFFLIGWIVVITFLSLVDLSSIDLQFDNPSFFKLDKIIHFLFYFVLFFLLINFFKTINIEKNANFLSLIIAIIYGIVIEVFQDIVPTKRNFDYYDILANSMGSISMFILLLTILKKNKKK